MPKKRDPSKEPPDTAPVKMAKDLHRKAKAIIAHNDKELYEFLDSILRPGIEKQYRELFRKSTE